MIYLLLALIIITGKGQYANRGRRRVFRRRIRGRISVWQPLVTWCDENTDSSPRGDQGLWGHDLDLYLCLSVNPLHRLLHRFHGLPVR